MYLLSIPYPGWGTQFGTIQGDLSIHQDLESACHAVGDFFKVKYPSQSFEDELIDIGAEFSFIELSDDLIWEIVAKSVFIKHKDSLFKMFNKGLSTEEEGDENDSEFHNH